MIENKTVSYSQIEEGYITAKRIVGKEINFLGGSSMKLTEVEQGIKAGKVEYRVAIDIILAYIF